MRPRKTEKTRPSEFSWNQKVESYSFIERCEALECLCPCSVPFYGALMAGYRSLMYPLKVNRDCNKIVVTAPFQASTCQCQLRVGPEIANKS